MIYDQPGGRFKRKKYSLDHLKMLLPTSSYKNILCQFLLALCVSFNLLYSQPVYSLDNGLALKPPMGWIAWERFTCQTDCTLYPEDCINSHLFKTIADAMVEHGYKQAGYEYVNIDDCWSEMERDPLTQQLVPDKNRFSEGIDKLADYIHSKQLKFGIYGDCGSMTCAGYPAQLKSNSSDRFQDNYFQLDANQIARWKVDSFKFDGCYIEPLEAESICPAMSEALRATNKSILLTCEWPFYIWRHHPEGHDPNFALVAEKCNLWRYYEDVEDSWASIVNIIEFTIKHQDTILQFHGPGHWFDPDQLVIGNFGLSLDQSRAQMAIWSIWSAPLFMGNDVRSIEAPFGEILKNKLLIRVNQDELGVFGMMVEESEGSFVFVKPITPVHNHCPSFAIVFLNLRTLGNKLRMVKNLRELLLKAPIKVAAKHQSDLIKRGLYSNKVLNSEDLIHPTKCRQYLEKSESIRFDLVDLLNGDLGGITMKAEAELELTVSPSGVRALTLVEASR